MEKFLRKLYKKFLDFDKNYYFRDVKTWFGVGELRLNKKILKEFYENYQKISFLEFLGDVKDIIYSKNVFDFIVKNATEDWDLWCYLKFLEKEKIIKVKKKGKITVLRKEILKIIPKPQKEKEIKRKIERKLKIKIREKEPVINLFKKFQDFKVKAKWDQMPISQGSAIFITEKILENIPLNKKFLFVGDDDFVSVILTLADSSIECKVVDIDEQLLECINLLSSKFNLKIETKKVDIRKEKVLGEKFIGFLTNPCYTEAGVKEFVKFGKNQLGKDGGIGFLEVGGEDIENRFLFLQDFFTKNNLIIEEIISKKIYYPYIMLHKEDKEIFRRLSLMIDEKVIKKSPKLGASLYIFEYLPFKPKRVKFKKPIYAYL
ncbi:MAG: bis-aminopropyl spermidine synthase family protein [Candidatus Paceibacterales bacterium]